MSAKALLKLGMVGGGQGAFIGAVHRASARLDGETALVCGTFSRDMANSAETGEALGLSADRCYSDYAQMLATETGAGESIGKPNNALECVSIVTPNDSHVAIAKDAIARGIHVICDKPAGVSLSEVEELAALLNESAAYYALTHTYLGYPMVWQARHITAQKSFGPVRKVVVNYTQGWLASQLEKEGSRQASWRTDPKRSGPAGAFGDIGSHAHSLVEFITNSRMNSLSARLSSAFADRALDDDGEARFTLENGATGTLIASQICAGDENTLTIRVYGENAGLEWHQMEPNTLTERAQGGLVTVHRAGADKPLCEEALARCRLPSGHPEGYLEAFANLYRGFAHAISQGITPAQAGIPGIAEALRGMAFLEAAVASSENDGAWTDIKAPSVGPDLKGLLS